jgi:hypothetical protein
MNLISSVINLYSRWGEGVRTALGLQDPEEVRQVFSERIPSQIPLNPPAPIHPLFHFSTGPSHEVSPLEGRIRIQLMGSISSCENKYCPLGMHSMSQIARSLINEKVIGSLSRSPQNEWTLLSYGAGKLMQDYLLLAKLPKQDGQIIRYIVIDPIYRSQEGQVALNAFSTLLKNVSTQTGIKIEVIAYASVEEYERSHSSRPDRIIDVDTTLLEDGAASPGSEMSRLFDLLKKDGEFFSLNIGVRSFWDSPYFDGRPIHFHHPLPPEFQLHGIPTLIHLKKGDRPELLQVQEYNPQLKCMEVV